MLEMENLEKLEKQEHQWINQPRPSLINLDKIRSYMKILLLGTNMRNIFNIYIHQKSDNLSSLSALTIDIQKALRTWEEFQL